MFRLAHISDVHLSPLPQMTMRQLLNKRITGFLNWKLNRKHKLGEDYLGPLIEKMRSHEPDHIVVTGDLTNLALPAEFARARKFLEQLGSSDTTSALCGNHDAYVPGAINRAIAAWEPYLSSEETPIVSKHSFPYIRRIGEIALIGCNSADATAPFMATGYFRKKQAKKLAAILQETEGCFRVVMIHHPPIEGATPYHKRLIGIKRFQQTIREHGAELILHGHTHMPDQNEIQGKTGTVPVIGVPAAGNGVGLVKPVARFNLFDIERTGDAWSTRWTAFEKDSDAPVIDKTFLS